MSWAVHESVRDHIHSTKEVEYQLCELSKVTALLSKCPVYFDLQCNDLIVTGLKTEFKRHMFIWIRM